MPRPNFKKVTFLCMQQLTNFPYIEEDFDALTNYELLSKVVEYLNKVIANENEQNESILELYNSFNDLKNYVDNYFENLDVQDEINNKLDKMVEDGQLEQIIEQFLQLTSLVCFDNVKDMKASPNLANGSYAKTLGYHTRNDGGESLYKIRTITNNDVIDEMFIIEMENDETLIAELIYTDSVNVKQLGAYGDETHDDTLAFQTGLNKVKKVIVPIGTYIINNLIMNTENELIGENKFLSILKQGTDGLSTPIVKSNYVNNTTEMRNIKLENLSVVSFGERTVYPIELYNCNSIIIENCRIEQTGASNSYYHGVIIGKSQGFSGQNFLAKIKNSRFLASKIDIYSTDSYIINNELWGNGVDCALHIRQSSTTNISQNEIVGGKVYGGIYIENSNQCLKITNNYFDGSYSAIDTKYGIYCNGTLKHSVITNNTFWYQKSGAIYLKVAQENVISNNTFEENDYYNTGASEIEIQATGNASFNNVISNNTFYRNKYYNTSTNQEESRPTDNPTPILKITNTPGYQASLVMNNTCSFIQYYGDAIMSGDIVSRNNTSTKFFYTLNYATNSIKNDKDIIYTDNNNRLTNNTSAVINGKLTRIDNIKVITVSSLTNFDCNASNTDDYKVYLNTPTGVSNIPSFVHGGALIEYQFIATGYALQTFTGYDSSNNFYRKSRFLINGSWGNWS